MLALFKKNDIRAVFGLLFLGILCHWHNFTAPISSPAASKFHKALFFQSDILLQWANHHPLLLSILSFLALFSTALYLNHIVVQEKMVNRKSYFVAVSFMLYTGFMPVFSVLSMPFFSALATTFAFAKCVSLNHSNQIKTDVFSIGVLLSLGTLFYFPAILNLFFFLFILILLRVFSPRDLVTLLLGFTGPMYVVGILIYIFGDSDTVLKNLFFHIEFPVSVVYAKQTLIWSALTLILFVYGSFLYQVQRARMHIAVRKKWNALALYLIAGVVSGLFSKEFPSVAWIVMIIPFSILLSLTFQSDREKVNTFTFYFFIIALLATQWLIK